MTPHTAVPGTAPAATDHVLTTRLGRVLRLELNRPRQLNALSHELVRALRAGIARAAADDGIEVVLLTGAGERAFSAGGDLKFLHADATGAGDKAMPLWTDLYALVADIAALSASGVPVVPLMDGIVLGGGMGIAGNCGVRVVTERAVLGMPETRIGLYPDTGGLSMLQRLTGESGTYLGTCAQSVNGADALAIGLADHFVPSSDLPAFTAAVVEFGLDDALASFATTPFDAPSLPVAWVDECFAGDDPVAILERLRTHPDEDARHAGELYASRSPASVAVTLAGLRAVATMTLQQDLALELRMTDRLRRSHDFIEGVRARLVDKDRDPQWEYADVSQVDPAWVASVVS